MINEPMVQSASRRRNGLCCGLPRTPFLSQRRVDRPSAFDPGHSSGSGSALSGVAGVEALVQLDRVFIDIDEAGNDLALTRRAPVWRAPPSGREIVTSASLCRRIDDRRAA